MFVIGNKLGRKFTVGHKYLVLSEQGRHKKSISMAGKNNPAKREEVRIKISNNRRGKGKGVSPWNKGLKKEDDVRIQKYSEKLSALPHPWSGKSITQKGRNRLRESKKGALNPNWHGGITSILYKIRNLPEYKKWVRDVFKKDDYTCQKCFLHGHVLEGHHIKRFSDIILENNICSVDDAINCRQLWDINNGQTLCLECHRKTDTHGRPRTKK